MILPRPIVPEMTEVMNENQKAPELVSMPESLLGIMSKTNVKCNWGMDSKNGSKKSFQLILDL